MRKAENIFWGIIALASIGVITFWVASFKGHTTIAVTAFVSAGLLCWAAIGIKFISWLRHRSVYGS